MAAPDTLNPGALAIFLTNACIEMSDREAQLKSGRRTISGTPRLLTSVPTGSKVVSEKVLMPLKASQYPAVRLPNRVFGQTSRHDSHLPTRECLNS